VNPLHPYISQRTLFRLPWIELSTDILEAMLRLGFQKDLFNSQMNGSVIPSKATSKSRVLLSLAGLLISVCGFGQNVSNNTVPSDDEEYGKQIRAFTTEPFFLTPWVDHLPFSKDVPNPKQVLGHAIGAPNILDYASDIHKYFRALASASKRIQIVSMGKSEEGREMIVAVISDEKNLQNLSQIKRMNASLGDPRTLKGSAEADSLIKQTLPIYWATGSMHAPETGSPEMLAELAYRLVTSEEPAIKAIRKNEIVLLTPVLDVDGRERVVDIYRYKKAHKDKPEIPLVYWGHYVAHDDNRDALTFRLALSQAMMKVWFDFHPTVLHDLHESVPYLYISTGTGPYNAWLDPIVIGEWQEMAYNEVDQMTAMGVPGVWTHGFYDGWGASYGFYVANGHNGIGRFYETFGADGADTGVFSSGSEANRSWYRPNPPFPKVRWSIRDNVNLSQSALLIGMSNVAENRERFLRNYYLKSARSVAKAKTEGPAAYVLAPQPASANFRIQDLLEVLNRQGVEVHKLSADFKEKDSTLPAGSYVIRMDQPYSRMADMMFDQQFYQASDPTSYDDTGWQLGPLYNLPIKRVTDQKLLDAKMAKVEISGDQKPSPMPALKGARVAMIHSWQATQDAGWARLAFESCGAPFTYTSIHELRDVENLRSKYDVILIPQTWDGSQDLVNGITNIPTRLPWKATPETPNLGGIDESDDIRGGIEFRGMEHLQRFVREGGTLICIGGACHLPIDYGLVSAISVSSGSLRAPGGVYRVVKPKAATPITAGYPDDFGIYFNSYTCTVFDIAKPPNYDGDSGPRASGRGGSGDPDVIQGRPPYTPKALPGDSSDKEENPDRTIYPKPVLAYASADKVLISGMIDHADQLAGKTAAADCAVGKGHIILFGFNPFWRGESVGSYDLVFNAIANALKKP
jgi:hypothetical protein